MIKFIKIIMGKKLMFIFNIIILYRIFEEVNEDENVHCYINNYLCWYEF